MRLEKKTWDNQEEKRPTGDIEKKNVYKSPISGEEVKR